MRFESVCHRLSTHSTPMGLTSPRRLTRGLALTAMSLLFAAPTTSALVVLPTPLMRHLTRAHGLLRRILNTESPPTPRSLDWPSMDGSGDAAWEGELATLRRRLEEASEWNFCQPESLCSKTLPQDVVYVLLFNPGQVDEGVYTLIPTVNFARIFKGGPEKHVVVFEVSTEAWRFAQMLQAEGFVLSRPSAWPVARLVAFCDAAGFGAAWVPQGAHFTPPKLNTYDMEAFADQAPCPPRPASTPPPVFFFSQWKWIHFRLPAKQTRFHHTRHTRAFSGNRILHAP